MFSFHALFLSRSLIWHTYHPHPFYLHIKPEAETQDFSFFVVVLAFYCVSLFPPPVIRKSQIQVNELTKDHFTIISKQNMQQGPQNKAAWPWKVLTLTTLLIHSGRATLALDRTRILLQDSTSARPTMLGAMAKQSIPQATQFKEKSNLNSSQKAICIPQC